MATLYWYGGTGTWDSSGTAHWSTTSGTTFNGTMTGSNTITVASVVGTALAIGKTIYTVSGIFVGIITGGSGTSWTLDTVGTYTNEPMGAGTAATAAPTVADTVTFDANSGAGVVSVLGDAICDVMTASAVTANTKFRGSGSGSPFTINTSAAIAAAATYDTTQLSVKFTGTVATSTLNCASTTLFDYIANDKTSGILAIATSALTCNNFDQLQSGSSTRLDVNLTCNILLSYGTLNVNAATLTVTSQFIGAFGSTTVMTSGLINVGTTVTGTSLTSVLFSMSGTYTRGTGRLIIGSTTPYATSATFSGGGQTYYDVLIQGTETYINDNNTFTGAATVGLRITSPASVYHFVSLGGTIQTVNAGTFSVVGNSVTNRALLTGSFTDYSSIGTVVLTGSGARTLTNVDLEFITFTYASAITGTSIGDWNGNTNVTVTTPVTRYAVTGGTAKNFSNTNMWSATSGGATGATVPLPQDTVIFNAASGSGAVTLDIRSFGKDITTTGFTGSTVAGTFTNTLQQNIFGNYVGSVSLLNVVSSLAFYGAPLASITIPAGLTVPNVYFKGTTATFTLAGDTTATSSGWAQYGATFNTGNYNISLSSFSTNYSLTAPTLTLGSSVITVSSTFNLYTLTTVTSNTSTLNFNPTSTSFTSSLASRSFGTINLNPTVDKTSFTFATAFTCVSFNCSTAYQTTINLSNSTTATITSLSLIGTKGYGIVIKASTNTGAATTIALGSNSFTRYTAFRAITKSGASTLTAYNVANLGRNSGITFAAAGKTKYWAFTTGASSFTVPANYGGSNMFFVVGGGGGAGKRVGASGGGGGAAIGISSNLNIAANQTIYYSVGTYGLGATTTASGGTGGATWVNTTANSSPATARIGAIANGGTGSGTSGTSAAGGTANTTVNAIGIAGGTSGASGTNQGGGGGGTCAFEGTLARAGANGSANSLGGGGGGGAGSITAGGAAVTGAAGRGGNGGDGQGTGGAGGATGTTLGTNGSSALTLSGAGGGGGGAVSSNTAVAGNGGSGGEGNEFTYYKVNSTVTTGTIGVGGAGGGGAGRTTTNTPVTPGQGGSGVYGSGGGGGGAGSSTYGNGGDGGGGLIIFAYEINTAPSFGLVIG